MSLEQKNQYSCALSHANRSSGEMGLANGSQFSTGVEGG